MSIDYYHVNIIKLLYNSYVTVLDLYYINLRANYMDQVVCDTLYA